MADIFVNKFIDGATRPVLQLSGSGVRTCHMECGSDWQHLHITWRMSWQDDGDLPFDGLSYVRPELFVGVCAPGKPWGAGNGMAWGGLMHNYFFTWGDASHQDFQCVFDGRSLENGVNTRPEVGNQTLIARYSYSQVTNLMMYRLIKGASWSMSKLMPQFKAFIGNPISTENYRAGLVTDNHYTTRLIWNAYGATVTQPDPMLFSVGGSRTPMDEASYGYLTEFCLFWDMKGSDHSVYLYDFQVARIS